MNSHRTRGNQFVINNVDIHNKNLNLPIPHNPHNNHLVLNNSPSC